MSTQKRNIWLDNVKGFLIICVVAGHFLESGIDYHSNMCKSLFLFIYSFHMPLFVFARWAHICFNKCFIMISSI